MDNSYLNLKSSSVTNKAPIYGLITILLLLILFFYFILTTSVKKLEAIKVGVLFSKTGAMAVTELPILRATILAIEEINNQGGINNRLIEPVIYDAASNWKQSAQLAAKMILEDKVVAIFGCFTSASRKEVKEVVEKYDNLLIYPVDYEGVEDSKNIIYLGMTPNQKLIPAVSWVFEQKGKRMYLAGSDYIWPRVANEIVAHEINMMGGEIVGTSYLLLGSTDVDPMIDDIIAKKPDFVFSTLIGTSVLAFLHRFYERIPQDQIPSVMAFGFIPFEGTHSSRKGYVRLHLVESYFKGLDNPENKAFLEAYKKRYGSYNEVEYPAATSYTGVYLWAQAVRQSPTPQPVWVRENMLRQSMASPAGVMYIDPNNANTWRSVFIERINEQGASEVIWTSNVPIEPIVYPEFKTKAQWDFFEYKLYVGWGNSWEKT
jgi:urea transport system substrate-binding protein